MDVILSLFVDFSGVLVGFGEGVCEEVLVSKGVQEGGGR